jgi:hypothetical protein
MFKAKNAMRRSNSKRKWRGASITSSTCRTIAAGEGSAMAMEWVRQSLSGAQFASVGAVGRSHTSIEHHNNSIHVRTDLNVANTDANENAVRPTVESQW